MVTDRYFDPANVYDLSRECIARRTPLRLLASGWRHHRPVKLRPQVRLSPPIHAVGFGTLHTGPVNEVSILTEAGIPVVPDFVNGGHEWYLWRILLKDFLTRVPFLPPAFAS